MHRNLDQLYWKCAPHGQWDYMHTSEATPDTACNNLTLLSVHNLHKNIAQLAHLDKQTC
jgi:hypothetical protein